MPDPPSPPPQPPIHPPEIPEISPIGPILPILPIPPIRIFSPPFSEPVPLAPTKKIDDLKARPFFLSPYNDTDNMVFRGAPRDSLSIKPIIDGQEILRQLEIAITRAESSVLMAFWSLDPTMKAVTNPKKTWLNLLIDAANRGVMVRIFMNDFDPAFLFDEHRSAWRRFIIMQLASARIAAAKFQVICSGHEAETSDKLMSQISIQKTGSPSFYDSIADQINTIEKNPWDAFAIAPGLWDKLDIDLAKKKVVPKTKNKSYPGHPLVHHQKLVIIDGKYAFVGGINITEGYLDSPKHRRSGVPWHDVFVKVEGTTILRDIIRNYVGLWNQERVRAEAFWNNASSSLNVKPRDFPSIWFGSELTEAMVPAQLTSRTPPKIPSQVHRTISKKGTDPSGVPITVRKDVLEGYLQAISQAENYIYLENQYFREKEIADAIIQQHKLKPSLQTIIVLPKTMEEELTGTPDMLSQHGAAIQFEILDEMNSKIFSNLGLFTMVRNDSQLIYVHSKLCIIDDVFASIGSANLNPRSMRADTELDMVWYHPTICRNLRLELWGEILGNPSTLKRWKPSEFISKWWDIATKNSRPSSRRQKGFVMPFLNEAKWSKSIYPITPFV